jgi:hypothetical protein
VLRNKVAKYFTQMGGAGLSLTTPSFRSKLDTLADDIQLMKYIGFCLLASMHCFAEMNLHLVEFSFKFLKCPLCRSASLLAKYRPLFSATITGRIYVPDTRRSSKRKAMQLA